MVKLISLKRKTTQQMVVNKQQYVEASIRYARMTNLAYKPKADIKHKFNYNKDFNLVGFIDEQHTGTFAYVVVCPQTREIFVVWRGTNEKKDWLSNLNAFLVRRDGFPGKIHEGFYQAIPFHDLDVMISPYISRGGYQLTNLGHSLGGALATLYTYHAIDTFNLRMRSINDVVTFGAPKVGNREFCRAFDRIVPGCVRFIHGHDIVPHLPWLFGLFYRHVGKSVFINDGQVYLNPKFKFNIVNFIVAILTINTLVSDHFMDAYIGDLLLLKE